MKISLILNEKPYIIEANPQEKLVQVLRRENLILTKLGCDSASCGSCYVLIDNKVMPSCIVPVGILKDSQIITLEHFSKSEIYSYIIKGFEKAGISLCGYCNAGKIFLTYEILTTISNPTRENISKIINKLNDCCVEKDVFINGILYAYSLYYEREKEKKFNDSKLNNKQKNQKENLKKNGKK